jgi:hypothetical protein
MIGQHISERRVRALPWRWFAVGLLALIVVFLSHEYVVHRTIKPPRANCTILELAEKVPDPVRLSVVSQDGLQRLVWIGPIPPLTIRSGPPCYVFDEHGQLVDWCSETGEGWSLDYMTTASYERQSMSLDDALNWINMSRRSNKDNK